MTIHLEHHTPKLLEIWEDELSTPQELHAYIASDMRFPAHYGGNLAALSDCLGDVSEPWAIIVTRSLPERRKPWFDGFCDVMERAACENPELEFHYDVPGTPRITGAGAFTAPTPTLDDVLALLERMDGRLDAMQAGIAGPRGQQVPPVSRVESETCRNMASGSDGDRFECGTCGCRVPDYLEDTRHLVDGLKYCPNCGREVANPEGNNALGWVGELI